MAQPHAQASMKLTTSAHRERGRPSSPAGMSSRLPAVVAAAVVVATQPRARWPSWAAAEVRAALLCGVRTSPQGMWSLSPWVLQALAVLGVLGVLGVRLAQQVGQQLWLARHGAGA